MEEERTVTAAARVEKGSGSGLWQAIMSMVASQGSQTFSKQSSREASRKLPEVVPQLSSSFFFFFFSEVPLISRPLA